MWERLTCQRDAQIGHMGKVGLGLMAGMMHLRKHDLLFRAMLGTPERNPAGVCGVGRADSGRMLVAQHQTV